MTVHHFLFLQGPPGAFFHRLGAEMVVRGARVSRINFNGGDRRAWPGATDYRGSAQDWPRFFDAFVRDRTVTDLILFGDCRPLHHAARHLAKLRGVSCHVFEEGYLRPDWVTLEADGVNGNSSLPRDPVWYLRNAKDLVALRVYSPLPFSFRRRALEAFRYYRSAVLQTWRFPGYRSHRHPVAVLEGLGWVRRFACRGRTRLRSARVTRDLRDTSYFVFPLQLDSDHQVRIHSPFPDVRSALVFVVESFARAAPAAARLAVKLHPLDNGLIDWRRATIAAARRFGVAHRVVMIEDGDIAELVERARGVVTINSTAGTFALDAGVPTIALGEAVYDIDGITHHGALDGFWHAPQQPDPILWNAFCRVLVDRCLIRGSFFSDEGLDLLIANAVERLIEPVAAHV